MPIRESWDFYRSPPRLLLFSSCFFVALRGCRTARSVKAPHRGAQQSLEQRSGPADWVESHRSPSGACLRYCGRSALCVFLKGPSACPRAPGFRVAFSIKGAKDCLSWSRYCGSSSRSNTCGVRLANATMFQIKYLNEFEQMIPQIEDGLGRRFWQTVAFFFGPMRVIC